MSPDKEGSLDNFDDDDMELLCEATEVINSYKNSLGKRLLLSSQEIDDIYAGKITGRFVISKRTRLSRHIIFACVACAVIIAVFFGGVFFSEAEALAGMKHSIMSFFNISPGGQLISSTVHTEKLVGETVPLRIPDGYTIYDVQPENGSLTVNYVYQDGRTLSYQHFASSEAVGLVDVDETQEKRMVVDGIDVLYYELQNDYLYAIVLQNEHQAYCFIGYISLSDLELMIKSVGVYEGP